MLLPKDLWVLIDTLIHRSLIDTLNREYRSLVTFIIYDITYILSSGFPRPINNRTTRPLCGFVPYINHHRLVDGELRYTSHVAYIPMNY